jgi:hypothetical protein
MPAFLPPGSAAPARPVAARAVDVVKTYGSGEGAVHALAGASAGSPRSTRCSG